MKTVLSLSSAAVLAAFFLAGCTDPKAPKAPPKVPEPKAAMTVPNLQHGLAPNGDVRA